jgi:NAD(P)-dependent dehydrogenase (short-subunit alcohol dehydrogenase family)
MEGFAGKVAVVTGAGSGIGQALAIELARSGASVAISDVDTEPWRSRGAVSHRRR